MEEGFGPCVDLLTEVEEVSSLFHGKVTEFDYANPCFGDVEGGGAPSLGLPDDLLPPALFGNPMLDQDLSPFLPPASPQPETLMQVSLTAGQPPAPNPRPSSPATPSPSLVEQTVAPRPHSPRHSSPVTPPSTPEHQIAPPSPSEDQPGAPRPPSPVRVVVRTSMVAPVNLEKSSRFLVRIPRSSPPPTARVTRHRVLRAGGKLGAAAAAAAASKPAEAPRSQAPIIPEPAATTTTTTTTTTCTPFRSLVGGVQGRTRHSSTSSTSSSGGTKRKAYELGPQKDPAMERCRQNAINARRNRELKKTQMAELERRAAEADEERQRLAEENRRLREDNTRLQREVGHLTGVLQNQSRLSHILEKVSPARLTLGDAGSLGEEEEGAEVSRGVCLHLDGDEATLECCAVCAKKAGRRLRHTTRSAAPVAVFSTCDQS